MKTRTFFKLVYFDGFAGSGFIINGRQKKIDMTIGAARRIVELTDPRPFDIYYFVEKDSENVLALKKSTKEAFRQKKIVVVQDDCNKKLIDLANFLRNPINRNFRTLAYIDPCGMQVERRSIENLRGLPIDMWILVPTGLGVNRLLKKNGQISDAWLEKLKIFLGLERKDIEDYFYTKMPTLFNEMTIFKKEADAIERSSKLYRKRLKEVFRFVSVPFELRNSMQSPMYHLFFASNNDKAVKIADDIVKKYNKLHGTIAY
jgi:three-Cys-motif partner protein